MVYLAGGLTTLNVLLSYLLPETHHQRSTVRGAALRAELARDSTPLTLWARLQARETGTPGIRRLAITQVAFTLSAGYYFYFIPFLNQGPLRSDARGVAYLFIFSAR